VRPGYPVGVAVRNEEGKACPGIHDCSPWVFSGDGHAIRIESRQEEPWTRDPWQKTSKPGVAFGVLKMVIRSNIYNAYYEEPVL
jgi:hypothetical protein